MSESTRPVGQRRSRRWSAVAALAAGALLALVGAALLGPGMAPSSFASDPGLRLDSPGASVPLGSLAVEVARPGPAAFLVGGKVERRFGGIFRGSLAVLGLATSALVLVVTAAGETRVGTEAAGRRHHRSSRGPPRT